MINIERVRKRKKRDRRSGRERERDSQAEKDKEREMDERWRKSVILSFKFLCLRYNVKCYEIWY